jgi:hypothetical protein
MAGRSPALVSRSGGSSRRHLTLSGAKKRSTLPRNSHGIEVPKSTLLATASWRRSMARRARSAADGQLWIR